MTYIWRNVGPGGNHESSSSNSFIHWLFAEERINSELLRNSVRASSRKNAEYWPDQSATSVYDSGLNLLTSRSRRPEKFLKQRLFDLRQIRDTSRFRESLSRRKSLCREVLSDGENKECQHRGIPDGEERLGDNIEEDQDLTKAACHKTTSEPFTISCGMRDVMKNARDIRRLIREGSFDSLASDFSLEFDLNMDSCSDFKTDIVDDDDNDITITDDNEEYVLDKNLLSRFEGSQMWRLTNSTRESSLVSDYSYDFKNDRQLKVYGGYTSDDLASLIGSQADALEWDEDCFLEDDAIGKDVSDIRGLHSAWLPDYDQELDLESELLERRMVSPSPGVVDVRTCPGGLEMKMTTEQRNMKHLQRLPPSGASSVESLV